MKMNKDLLKGFVVGVLSAVLFSSLVGGVLAASSGQLVNIRAVFGGINLFIDGKPFIPKDANGNTVEPFIYDGVTYLPLRVTANALGKEITYDGSTSSVYIGRPPGGKTVMLDRLQPYDRQSMALITNNNYNNFSFQILDKTITPMNRTVVDFNHFNKYLTYILDSQYKSIEGKFVIPYTQLGVLSTSSLSFYNVAKNGDETLIAEYTTQVADEPLDIRVDLRGVEILRIYIDQNIPYYTNHLFGTFYDVFLTEMD